MVDGSGCARAVLPNQRIFRATPPPLGPSNHLPSQTSHSASLLHSHRQHPSMELEPPLEHSKQNRARASMRELSKQLQKRSIISQCMLLVGYQELGEAITSRALMVWTGALDEEEATKNIFSIHSADFHVRLGCFWLQATEFYFLIFIGSDDPFHSCMLNEFPVILISFDMPKDILLQ